MRCRPRRVRRRRGRGGLPSGPCARLDERAGPRRLSCPVGRRSRAERRRRERRRRPSRSVRSRSRPSRRDDLASLRRRHLHRPCRALVVLRPIVVARKWHWRARLLRRRLVAPRRRLPPARHERRLPHDRLAELGDAPPLPSRHELVETPRSERRARVLVRVVLCARLGQNALRRRPARLARLGRARVRVRPAERRTQPIRPRRRRLVRLQARAARVCAGRWWRTVRGSGAVAVDGRGGRDGVAEGEGGRV